MSQKYLLPYQIEWIKDKSPIKIWEKSRRIGATYAQSYEDVQDCIQGKISAVWFSSMDDSAAKEYIDYCKKWAAIYRTGFEAEDIKDPVLKESTHQIKFANGTKITAGSSNPDFFRSKGGKVVLDEFAFHDDAKKLWKAAMACAKVWGHPIRILSTHNGQACLYYKFLGLIDKGKLVWGRHKTSIHDALDQGLLDKIRGHKTSKAQREEWLAELRADSIDETTFKEEFECIAVDEATAFLSYELIRSCEIPPFLKDEQKGVEKGKKWEINTYTHPYKKLENAANLYIGMDVARRKHLSSIWVAESVGRALVPLKIITLQNCSFKTQGQILRELLARQNVVRACIDATGLGEQLAEEAQEMFGSYRVEAVKFTNASKNALMFGLLTGMEEALIGVPTHEEIREDFHSLKKITGVNGQIRFDVEGSEGHADIAVSCALCHSAAKAQNPIPFVGSGKHRSSVFILEGY